MYPKTQYEQFSFDREHGILDLTDTILVIGDNFYKDHSARHTTSLQVAEYFMYVSTKSTEIKENFVLEFLLAPFSLPVWILTLFFVSFIFLLKLAVSHRNTIRNHFKRYVHRGFFIVSLGCVYLTIAYSSNLKALLAAPTENDNFENLYDLAKQVEDRSKILIVEARDSHRWGLLRKDGFNRSEPFEALYDAIRQNDQQNLLIEPNLARACELMKTSTKYVLFGHEDMIHSDALCSRLCLWKYRVTEHPSNPITWLVGNKTLVSKYADILVHGLESFRQLEIRRLFPVKCEKSANKKKALFIGHQQFYVAYLFLCVGLGGASIVLCVELFFDWHRNRLRTFYFSK